MATILFENVSGTGAGYGFKVHLDLRLRTRPSQSFINPDRVPEILTETGKKIYEGIRDIPGIDREVLVSTYSFQTGIGYAFDPKLVIEQVIAVIQSIGENVQVGYLVPERRISLVNQSTLIAVEDTQASS